ncbi:MAG: tyrosine-type recombinase/integrase [Solirubrobacterales bacterium]|nr:tyrosine-type recombinase/integrase [Solirubrobacterales bacterium]
MTRLPSTRPTTSTSRRSAGSATGSSRPRSRTSSSPPPRYREGVLGGGPVLWAQTRRAARSSVEQRRLRQRRDPGRALVGSRQGPGRRQDGRRPARRADGFRRPPRAHGPQAAHPTRRRGSCRRPHQGRGVVASTIRARANKAWKEAGIEPITPHEARHCAISCFIAAGLDWKQISTWAGHGDVRQTWNRYGHLVPGGEEQARERLDAYLNAPTLTPTVAHDSPERRNPRQHGGSEVPLPGFEPGFPP